MDLIERIVLENQACLTVHEHKYRYTIERWIGPKYVRRKRWISHDVDLANGPLAVQSLDVPLYIHIRTNCSPIHTRIYMNTYTVGLWN